MAHRITLAGQDLGVWDLDRMTLKESFVIKAATGLDVMVLSDGFETLDPAVWQAIVWWLRRKTEPHVQLVDIDFAWADLDAKPVEEPPLPPVGAGAADSETPATPTPDATI